MPDPVKPRKYESPRRAAQAADTRNAVLAAAHETFVASGWGGTTIGAIAKAAGVSNETIYAGFGSKKAILQELISNAVRGRAPDVPLLEQEGPRGVLSQSDPHRLLASFSRDIAEILDRVAPLIAVVRSAAENDREMAELYLRLQQGRRRNLSAVGKALADRGWLRKGLTGEAATAEIWRIASPELFLLIRATEGLELNAYATWLADTLSRKLISD